jgi:hypothetical protein
VKRVSVGTHALDVGCERRRERVPVVRGERVEISLDDCARECLGDQSLHTETEGELGDDCARRRAHLADGLHDDARQSHGFEARGDLGELRLEEGQAERVFEQLQLVVGAFVAEAVFAHEGLYSCNVARVVARVVEQFRELARVLLVQRVPPADSPRALRDSSCAASSTGVGGDRAPRGATARSVRAGTGPPSR